MSSRLEGWQIKSTRPFLANFRCPICKDSKKSRTKKRGYLYERKNEIWFKCYNSCPGKSLKNFIKDQNPLLLKEYVFEQFKETKGSDWKSNNYSSSSRSSSTKLPEVDSDTPRMEIRKGALRNLKSIGQLDRDHPARLYVDSRLLPAKSYDLLFYAPQFGKWVNSQIPGKLDTTKGDEPRLIIPFINRKGQMFGFQGRSFDPKTNMRYISIMLDTSETKVFGMDGVDFNSRVYVLEGAIDALFIDNAVASIQGDLSSIDHLLKGRRVTFIPDKDRRNPQIVRLIKKLIVSDKDVCLLEPSVPGKDINEIVLNGFPKEDLKAMIDSRTYNGAQARLEFTRWNKT